MFAAHGCDDFLTHAQHRRSFPGLGRRGAQPATVHEVLMGRYAKHVGPVCENARNAPERRASGLLLLQTRFNHQLYFDHIRRHERPP